jgi:hypothetical protein
MPTMTIGYLVFPTGLPVPDLPSFTIPFTPAPGGIQTTAPSQVIETPPTPNYAFGFWDVDGTFQPTATVRPRRRRRDALRRRRYG